MKKRILIEILIVIIPVVLVSFIAFPRIFKNFEKLRMATQIDRDYLYSAYTVKDHLRDSGEKTLYNSKVFNKALYSNTDLLEDFVKRYYKVSRMCTPTTPGGTRACSADYYIGLTDGKKFGDFNGDVCVVLKAGTTLCFNRISSKNQNSKLYIDVNGVKGPNTWGRDAYRFEYDENGDLGEVDVKLESGMQMFEYCGKDQYGTGCYSKLLMDGWVMNY